MAIDGVRRVTRVRSRWIGADMAVDLVVLVDPDLSTMASHDIADRAESALLEDLNVPDVSIHIEPDLASTS